jgi:tetratricopeptide (TPR) repeat protein
MIDWERAPKAQNLQPLLDSLYVPFLSDGANLHLSKFFTSLRQNIPMQRMASVYKIQMLAKYSFNETPPADTAELWIMPTMDARRLFLLAQVQTDGIPEMVLRAMFKSIYMDVERCFGFSFVFKNRFGVFPASEYRRLLEILIRNSAHQDPFLKSWNLYCQGVILLNLENWTKGRDYISMAGHYLKKTFDVAQTQLARKIILFHIAQSAELLGNLQQAESAYVQILRMDPQDFYALNGLSTVLQKLKQCSEPAIWIEATAKSNQQLYDITVHCGTKEWQPQETNDETPFNAQLTIKSTLLW